jgi:hypothetical protein
VRLILLPRPALRPTNLSNHPAPRQGTIPVSRSPVNFLENIEPFSYPSCLFVAAWIDLPAKLSMKLSSCVRMSGAAGATTVLTADTKGTGNPTKCQASA